MNFENFTQDQKDAVWLILGLLTFAAVTFAGGSLLVSISPLIAILLFIGGFALIALSLVGYYIEFVDNKNK